MHLIKNKYELTDIILIGCVGIVHVNDFLVNVYRLINNNERIGDSSNYYLMIMVAAFVIFYSNISYRLSVFLLVLAQFLYTPFMNDLLALWGIKYGAINIISLMLLSVGIVLFVYFVKCFTRSGSETKVN